MKTLQDIPLPVLIEAARQGNEDSFHALYERLVNQLFSYAVTRVASRDDAMDVVQDTFVDFWKSLTGFRYRSDEAFYSFMFTILKRKLARYYRNRKLTAPIEDHEPSYEIEHEDYRYLLKHVSLLTERYREIISLRYWSGMKFTEIAAILNVKETTAKVWHHRAMNELRKHLYDRSNPHA